MGWRCQTANVEIMVNAYHVIRCLALLCFALLCFANINRGGEGMEQQWRGARPIKSQYQLKGISGRDFVLFIAGDSVRPNDLWP